MMTITAKETTMTEPDPYERVRDILKRSLTAVKFSAQSEYQFRKWCDEEPDRIMRAIYDTKIVFREADKLNVEADVSVGDSTGNWDPTKLDVRAVLQIGEKWVVFDQRLPLEFASNDDFLKNMAKRIVEGAIARAAEGLDEEVFKQLKLNAAAYIKVCHA
jgi:hypothetical protein